MNVSAHLFIPELRKSAFNIFQAGIAAADPYQAITSCLLVEDDQLQILLNDIGEKRTGTWPKIHLLAFGKAACPMIKAAIAAIPPYYLSGQEIAVTNYENVKTVPGVNVIGAAHPLPDEAGFNAARLCATVAQDAKQDELVLVLVSGGGSALIPYPVDSVTLQEKILTTDLLLASGATINQVNCVRKHLSQLKGGGLARMVAPAALHTLILSDVIGDDLSAIASGPTVPDDTTFSDAIDVLKTKDIWNKVPDSVRHYLEIGHQGKVRETPKSGESFFAASNHTLIGSNRMSVNAILQTTREQGFEAILYSDNLCGEASDEAENFVQFAKAQLSKAGNRPIALLAGGETTVSLKGKGRGGRNQEMALAFAIHAEQQKLPGNWVFLSGGTDGRDGPTDAAGGIVDSGTIQRMLKVGINPSALLDNNDSYSALKTSDDLLMTGATGTNVADLQVLLIQP
ncbi:glycerate kinase [Methyloglobulus sp.]|uniref:glycerate kinase type-2 family protein n=1 Tax=Methyloglobulus sp. TaxID=2518622 RepID=UPI0032B7D573